MALTLKKTTKQIPLAGKAPAHALSDFAALIDEVAAGQADHETRLAAIKELQDEGKEHVKKLAELQKLMATIGDPDDTEVEQYGSEYVCEGGKRGSLREIKDLAKARKFLGDKVFMALAKINIGDLDKYLNPPQLEEVLETKRTEKRELKFRKRTDV